MSPTIGLVRAFNAALVLSSEVILFQAPRIRAHSMIVLVCPHCQGTVVVDPQELNCRIFRHGVFRTTGEPIHPHAPREECERLVAAGAIFGCGGPFRVERTAEGEHAVVCDYI